MRFPTIDMLELYDTNSQTQINRAVEQKDSLEDYKSQD